MRKIIKSINGFTLLELIVVIAIIGIIAGGAIALVNPIEQIKKSSDAKRKSDLAQVQKALEIYYQDFGSYPTQGSNYRLTLNSVAVDWGSAWGKYMNLLPKDPKSNYRYVYISANSDQSYYLYTLLERGSKDPDACSGTRCPNSPNSSSACGGGYCNYGVSSPDVTP